MHVETEAKIAPQIIHFLKIARSGYRQKVEDLSLDEVKENPGIIRPGSLSGGVRQDLTQWNCTLRMLTRWLRFFPGTTNGRDDYGGSLKKTHVSRRGGCKSLPQGPGGRFRSRRPDKWRRIYRRWQLIKAISTIALG